MADLTTIPIKSRRQFINRRNIEEPFDLLGYLAEYERIKPGAFAIRDEEVKFKQKDDDTWIARINSNVFPGVYRVAVYVEGSYLQNEEEHEKKGGRHHDCCKHVPQRFTRILNSAIALGIKPDQERSHQTLYWTAPNKFVVSVTPTDALGNIALPTGGVVPAVTVNGQAIRSQTLNPFTGELQPEITLIGDKIEIASDGHTIKCGEALIETPDGNKLSIKAGEKLKVIVEFSDSKFTVAIPKFIGEKSTRKAFAAGTQEAMKIPLENRQPLASEKEAKELGYQI